MTANRVINATDSALDEAPESFDGIRVNFADHIDALTVIDSFVSVSASVKAIVGAESIGKDGGLREHMFLDESAQRVGLNIGSDEGANLPLPLNHANNGRLGGSAPSRALGFATVVRLIHFDFAVESTNRAALFIAKHGTNLLKHAPCCLVRYARLALNLLCGDSATGLRHEVDRMEPSGQRSRGLVKDRVSCRVNVMAAMIAGIRRAAHYAVMLCDRVARFAKDAVRVQVVLEPFKTGGVVWELLLEVFHREREHIRFAVVVGHELTYFQVKT